MSNVQLENGFTRIANELLEALARTSLSTNQARIVFALCRKTYGYGKREDRISVSQFEAMTGIARRNVLRTLKELKDRSIIYSRAESHMIIYYGMQKNYSLWDSTGVATDTSLKGQLVSTPSQTGVATDTKTGVATDTHKRNKKNIQKKYTDKASLSAHVDEKFQGFSTADRDLIAVLINKVRISNKTKTLAASRVDAIVSELQTVSDKYGKANMIEGIKATFRKADKDGFDFTIRNICGYLTVVANNKYIANKTDEKTPESLIEKNGKYYKWIKELTEN